MGQEAEGIFDSAADSEEDVVSRISRLYPPGARIKVYTTTAREAGWRPAWWDSGADRAGKKDDAGKLRFDLLPWKAVASTAGVTTFGAAKYTENGWQTVPRAKSRYFAAALRHLWSWWTAATEADRLDPESGLPHLAHAACCILFLLELELDGKLHE